MQKPELLTLQGLSFQPVAMAVRKASRGHSAERPIAKGQEDTDGDHCAC